MQLLQLQQPQFKNVHNKPDWYYLCQDSQKAEL